MTSSDYIQLTVEIHTKKGYVGIIDSIDADLVQFAWIAKVSPAGVVYLHRNIFRSGKRTTEDIQPVIMARILNRPLVKGEYVDHIDRNGLNNRRENLRLCSFSQNLMNQKRYKNNTTGYKGVSFYKALGKFMAYINFQNKRIHLGYFDTALEAYAAYCEAAKKYHGEFARLD